MNSAQRVREDRKHEEQVANSRVYVLESPEVPGRVKIGITWRGVDRRCRELQKASPVELRVAAALDPSALNLSAYQLERALHAHFVARRLHGEWFRLTVEDVWDAVASL